jgi:hypothetical protein
LVYSKTLVPGQPEDVRDLNQILYEARNAINSLNDANIIAGADINGAKLLAASVADSKLASPNNSSYRSLLTANCNTNADIAAATYFLTEGALVVASGGNITAASQAIPEMLYFDDADYTVNGLTQKLRLRAQVCTNATAWSAVTATFGLYPVTFAGGADVLVATAGTVVSGSTVAIANPAASTVTQGNSGDFTVPSDGQYALGVVISATLTNNAIAALSVQLQTRSV